jgi:hypothetical protein
MQVKMWPKGSLPPVHLKLFQMKRDRKRTQKRLRFNITNRLTFPENCSILNK